MNTLSALNQASKDHRRNSGTSKSSRSSSSSVANIPLYRFAKPTPAKRSSSSSSSSSSSVSDTESDSGDSALSRTSSINSNASSGATSPSLMSPSSQVGDDELNLKQDIRKYWYARPCLRNLTNTISRPRTASALRRVNAKAALPLSATSYSKQKRNLRNTSRSYKRLKLSALGISCVREYKHTALMGI